MRLIILGAGGFGRTAADVAEQMGTFREIFFLDDNSREKDVLGPCDSFKSYIREDTAFYPAFGNNELRMRWLDAIRQGGGQTATLIHPTAYVSPRARIEPGTAILPGAMVNTQCTVGRGCILNLGVLIDHGCVLGEGAHICVGAIVKAENRIPDGMKVEAGTVIENRTYPL